MGETVTLTADDGHTLAAYRAWPEGAPKGGVVVAQEIFGVNDHIREVCDGYAAAGYLAVAPAIFDRHERGIELGYGPEDIARGRDIRAKIDMDDVIRDVAAAADCAAEAGRVGIVGYCWGGLIVYVASCRLGAEVRRALGSPRRLVRLPATVLRVLFAAPPELPVARPQRAATAQRSTAERAVAEQRRDLELQMKLLAPAPAVTPSSPPAAAAVTDTGDDEHPLPHGVDREADDRGRGDAARRAGEARGTRSEGIRRWGPGHRRPDSRSLHRGRCHSSRRHVHGSGRAHQLPQAGIGRPPPPSALRMAEIYDGPRRCQCC